MLFRQHFLNGIAAGEITLAFRRWRKPTVKAGGTLLTAAGQLSIQSVDEIELAQLKPRDAKLAGFDSLAALQADLANQQTVQREGKLYRVRFTLAGPDPRIALRETAELSSEEIVALSAKLARLDDRCSSGPWTRKILKLLARHPELSAGELAARCKHEKEWLKLNVRKLKNLGLTESLNPGYCLSPRGESYLRQS